MRESWFVLLCIVFLGVIPGRGARCDVYIANVGCGNCVHVRFSEEREGLCTLQKGLWVDCGLGPRGNDCISRGDSREDWDETVGNFFWGEDLPLALKRLPPKDVLLWITHLHKDHINKAAKINGGSENGDLEVGFAVVGVGAKANGCLPKGVMATNNRGKPSVAAEVLGKVSKCGTIAKVRVWGEEGEKQKFTDSISAVVRKFLNGFPNENGGVRLRPLIPSQKYGPQKRKSGEAHVDVAEDGSGATAFEDNLDANDTSLVLGLEYHGIKMLFPGDAPGEMYDCLEDEDRKFVENVDILIAPHHGSESAHNSSWYSSNNRFCTVISGDPYCGEVVLGLGSYGVRDSPVRLKEGKRPFYYSNTSEKSKPFKCESRMPVFCTRTDVGDKEGGIANTQKFVGYHIKIDGNENQKKIERIKLYEILSNKDGDKEPTERPIEIEEIPENGGRGTAAATSTGSDDDNPSRNIEYDETTGKSRDYSDEDEEQEGSDDLSESSNSRSESGSGDESGCTVYKKGAISRNAIPAEAFVCYADLVPRDGGRKKEVAVFVPARGVFYCLDRSLCGRLLRPNPGYSATKRMRRSHSEGERDGRVSGKNNVKIHTPHSNDLHLARKGYPVLLRGENLCLKRILR